MLNTRLNTFDGSEDLIGTRWEQAFPGIDTDIQFLVRTIRTDAERPVREALNTRDQLLDGYYLVGQTNPSIGSLGSRTFDRIYAPIPTLPDEVQPYQISTYIISENAVGWNTQGTVPPGAQQVARVTVAGATSEWNYVTGIRIEERVVPNYQPIGFVHPDGWSGYVGVTNNNYGEPLDVTVWGASAGRRAPLGVENEISATLKRDFFLVGPEGYADYALATDIPKYSDGDTYSSGLYVVESPTIQRWKGNIYERQTLVTDQIRRKKFRY